MSTIFQINANRNNSQKSTGPRTEAGKLTSSQNALKTGIYSESEIVYGESEDDLKTLTEEYYTHHRPESPEQRAMVDILIHSEWTLRRLRRAEAQLWNRDMDWNRGNADGDDDLGFALARNDAAVYTRLQRRIDCTQRNYQRALKDLQNLKEVGLQPAQGFSPVQVGPVEPEPAAAPAIGFVPSNLPQALPGPAVIVPVPTPPPAAGRISHTL